MVISCYDELCLFRRLPNTSNNRKFLMDYIRLRKLPIEIHSTDSCGQIYRQLDSCYRKKISLLTAVIKSYIIRKQYLLITSKWFRFEFRLAKVPNKNVLSIFHGSFSLIERKLLTTKNLIDNQNIAELNSDIVFICREKNNLYAFDLREINEMSQLVNPYTNQSFNQLNQSLIKSRIDCCPLSLLKLEKPNLMSFDLKINQLVSQLGSHCGIYIDINDFKKKDNQAFKEIITEAANVPIVWRILKNEHKHVLSLATTTENYKNSCINLLLYIAQCYDILINERCLIISQIIQDLPRLYTLHNWGPISQLRPRDQIHENLEQNDLQFHENPLTTFINYIDQMIDDENDDDRNLSENINMEQTSPQLDLNGIDLLDLTMVEELPQNNRLQSSETQRSVRVPKRKNIDNEIGETNCPKK